MQKIEQIAIECSFFKLFLAISEKKYENPIKMNSEGFQADLNELRFTEITKKGTKGDVTKRKWNFFAIKGEGGLKCC